MQAIYYPITQPEMNEKMVLVSNHDEYSYWFDIKSATEKFDGLIPMPDPKPGISTAISRTRLGQINDENHLSTLVKAVNRICQGPSKVLLFLSDQSILPLIVSKMAKNCHITTIATIETDRHFQDILKGTMDKNGLKIHAEHGTTDYENLDFNDFDVILAEPSYSISYLPWHNLYFWYMLKNVGNSVKIMPKKATIWCCPVTFEHLWKIRAPLKSVEGFNLRHFDDIIMEACDISDAEVEPQPLWEYPCQARSQPKPLITFNFNEKVPEKIIQTTQKFDNLKMNKRGSGVVFWMDWYLTDQDVICTGPTHPIEPNVNISWNMHHKQGVHFFVEQSEEIQIEKVTVDLIFEPMEGDISFAFQAE